MNHRLDSLKRFYKKKRRLPSYSEMLQLFGVNSKNSIFKIIKLFVEEGFIKKESGKLSPTSKFFQLPLLGLVKAGFPILAEEDKKYITLDDYLIGDPVSSFLLTVSGDSLMDLGIFEGDIVIVERRKNAQTGDIVLAEIDRSWTLKIFRKDKTTGKPYLIAANAKYPPFYPREELIIHGVIKALVRKIH
ncbi:MAG: S24 family peptidase [Patescibacteria group bacterium]